VLSFVDLGDRVADAVGLGLSLSRTKVLRESLGEVFRPLSPWLTRTLPRKGGGTSMSW
jgi:hypothetical protein